MRPRSRRRVPDLPDAFGLRDPVPTLANSSAERIDAFTSWLAENLPRVDWLGLVIPADGATIGDVLDHPTTFPTLTSKGARTYERQAVPSFENAPP